MMLDITQFLLPDTRQFTTLQQFFLDDVYQFDAGSRGQQVLLLPTDIVALEECLDDARTGGRTPDTILFHGGTQLLIIHKLTRCLHGT